MRITSAPAAGTGSPGPRGLVDFGWDLPVGLGSGIPCKILCRHDHERREKTTRLCGVGTCTPRSAASTTSSAVANINMVVRKTRVIYHCTCQWPTLVKRRFSLSGDRDAHEGSAVFLSLVGYFVHDITSRVRFGLQRLCPDRIPHSLHRQ